MRNKYGQWNIRTHATCKNINEYRLSNTNSLLCVIYSVLFRIVNMAILIVIKIWQYVTRFPHFKDNSRTFQGLCRSSTHKFKDLMGDISNESKVTLCYLVRYIVACYRCQTQCKEDLHLLQCREVWPYETVLISYLPSYIYFACNLIYEQAFNFLLPHGFAFS